MSNIGFPQPSGAVVVDKVLILSFVQSTEQNIEDKFGGKLEDQKYVKLWDLDKTRNMQPYGPLFPRYFW